MDQRWFSYPCVGLKTQTFHLQSEKGSIIYSHVMMFDCRSSSSSWFWDGNEVSYVGYTLWAFANFSHLLVSRYDFVKTEECDCNRGEPMKNGMIECSVCHSKLVSPNARTFSRAYDRHKSRVSSKQRAINVLLVVGDCILVGLQVTGSILDLIAWVVSFSLQMLCALAILGLSMTFTMDYLYVSAVVWFWVWVFCNRSAKSDLWLTHIILIVLS